MNHIFFIFSLSLTTGMVLTACGAQTSPTQNLSGQGMETGTMQEGA